jgi:hypothetical protein
LGIEGDVPDGTAIRNEATVEWPGGREQLGPVTTVVEVPEDVLGVDPDQGGRLQHRCGVTLDVPPGAVQQSTRFEVGPLDSVPNPPEGMHFANRIFAVNAFSFGDPVRQFDAPLTIEVRYTDEDVAGLKRETLRLWTREGPEGPWQMMGEPVRTGTGLIVHTTTHLSEFALFGEADPAALVDLQVRAMAPTQVDAGSTYVVNVSFANKGGANAVDNWVRVTVPEGTDFVAASYIGGDPRPPDAIDGRELTWQIDELVADSTWSHILIELEADASLEAGATLTAVAEIGGTAPDVNLTNNQVEETSTVIDPGPGPEMPHKLFLSFIVR